jgi:protein-tyrosine phosphatase
MIDLHSHLLPGLDDGPVDWHQSLEMARMAVDEGISEMVCTPHWVYGLYDNFRKPVLLACGMLRQKLAESVIPLKVYPGCEVRIEPDIIPHIASGRLLTLNDTGKYVLIELPGEFVPSYVESILRALLDQQITPVLSHPERNPALIQRPEHLCGWVEMGVLCQITAGSLRGRFGPLVRRFTMALLEHQIAHVMATDAHAPKVRAPRMAEAVLELEKLIGAERTELMIVRNPQAILAGEPIKVPAPIPISRSDSSSIAKWRLFSIHP